MREPIAIWSLLRPSSEPACTWSADGGDQVSQSDAPPSAGCDLVGGGHHLARDQRGDLDHAVGRAQARGEIVERRDPLQAGLDRDVAVEAEHPA